VSFSSSYLFLTFSDIHTMALYDIKIQIEKLGCKVFILVAFAVSVAHVAALLPLDAPQKLR